MSDEHYFGPPKDDRPRHHSGPFFDPPYGDYEEYRETTDSLPERMPRNIESIKKWLRERNPHGD
jgi:hypothetical protein